MIPHMKPSVMTLPTASMCQIDELPSAIEYAPPPSARFTLLSVAIVIAGDAMYEIAGTMNCAAKKT